MPVSNTLEPVQKITVEISKDLLEAARQETGEGITQTVAAGLEKLARSKGYRALRELRGSCNIDLDIAASREDRTFE